MLAGTSTDETKCICCIKATRQMDGSKASVTKVMQQQIAVGLLLGLALAAVGFVRVYVTDGHFENSCAISVSLFLIVLVSTILGTSLPFALFRFGVDPANAGTSIQVSELHPCAEDCDALMASETEAFSCLVLPPGYHGHLRRYDHLLDVQFHSVTLCVDAGKQLSNEHQKCFCNL